ncbi:AdoMet-dependent rRNA methyltransferase spb-1 [Annulohypoxylon maeteangense]|uniref:AdoMet-dependent rRNA methyltransferase spb-1 n=1 Tax=Annulohypoxylon maeteangense TaxID=1927788 RepID=UPI002007F885|nr:AdoMet-dependent rRNA methyltransferase spb-1 [Annulohypoxylon maeteangense]KAI0883244.1 AdoMet-dependent rRNA methyltransferase spb-1 [Annulohypoxylon maeteangense]
MAIQKKHGKGRLDKWYRLAKEKGYRARAAFKLIQLNKKYGFLEKSKVLLDLCAAPGSWCQVAAEAMPANSLIVGVDLSPIKPIPKVITFQSDITTDKCRATIRQHLKTWKADTVLHDGAPNVGTAWVQDSFNQAELALQSMKLATEFLVEGGTFVTKVFRSKEYNKLLWVFNQLFTKVESTKPPSSRNVSAEIFVVCRGYKAPKHLDPKFLDPRSVFAELADQAPNNEAKVYKPEIKKRKRGGYEEGDYTQFKEIPASQFIETVDPIAILGSYNKLSFEQPRNGDVALAALDKMPDTNEEIRICCADLKVLGRREFKLLLKWRLKAREAFGLPTKKTAKSAEPEEEVAEVESMDEELKIQEELQALKDKDNSKKKRERRKENEQKQKEIVRMQLHMVAPMDIGMEQDGPAGHDSMFALKPIDKHGAANKIAKGKMAIINESKKDKDSGIGSSGDTDEEDEEEDRLERELDGMYDQYRERKAASDAKYRAKRARKEHDDGEWEGVSGDEQQSSDEEGLDVDEDSNDDSDEDEAPSKPLLTDLDNQPAASGGLSKRATNFFSQDIFKDISGILDEPEADEMDVDEDGDSDVEIITTKKETKAKKEKVKTPKGGVPSESEDGDQGGFEVVKQDEEDDWENEDKRRADGRLDIDIITAEAMTLAHQLATGQKTNYDVVDDGFNKRAFRDRDGLPDWFIDDESRHDKPQKPITKAAAAAIKEKTRALNARPIKKVREAKARKKFKAAQRLEKLKKKSDLLANEEGLTEKEKADSISRLISKAAKKKPSQPAKLVVARGLNRGIKGRPKGVKGRYKIVDPRMKKELRAQKRIAKRK